MGTKAKCFCSHLPFEKRLFGNRFKDAPAVHLQGDDVRAGVVDDVLQAACLVLGVQHKGDALLLGAAGAADAVQVGVVLLGNVVVKDNLDAADVDAAGGHIGGDQDVDLAGLVLFHDLVALRLAHVAVQAGGVELLGVQLLGHHAGGVFGVAEDDGAADLELLHQAQDNFDLLPPDALHAVLVDLRLALLHRQHGDLLRVALEQPADVHDLPRNGGGKHAHLLHRLERIQDFAHVLIKAHVQHPVGLVEHRGGDRLERDGPVLHQVEQAAGGGH